MKEEDKKRCSDECRKLAYDLEGEGIHPLHVAFGIYEVFKEMLEKGEALNDDRMTEILEDFEEDTMMKH